MSLAVQFLLGCDACGEPTNVVAETLCNACREREQRATGARCAAREIEADCWTVRDAARFLVQGEPNPSIGWSRGCGASELAFARGFDAELRRHFGISATTRVKFDADSDRTCTLASLIAANELDDQTIAEILALPVGGRAVLGQCDVIERVADAEVL